MIDRQSIERFLNYPRTLKIVAINCFAAGGFVVLIFFGSVGISTNGKTIYFPIIPDSYNSIPIKSDLIIWIAATLVLAAINLLNRLFLTPEVLNPKCPYCGGNVETSKLHCLKCDRQL